MSIIDNKEGRALAAKLNAEYLKQVEEAYLKECADIEDPRYSDWSQEMVDCYNEHIKHLIEERLLVQHTVD